MELNCAEKFVAVTRQAFQWRACADDRPLRHPYQAHKGRAACHYCGPCERGCITLSYFNSVNATLPAAAKTGRMTLRPFSVVHSVIFDSATRKATGVRCWIREIASHFSFAPRSIFLCASTLESVRLLFNSSTTEFPEWLGKLSDELGHNLMDHVKTGGVTHAPRHGRSPYHRSSSQWHLCAAFPEREDQAPRLLARLRISRPRFPRRMGPGNRTGWLRPRIQKSP